MAKIKSGRRVSREVALKFLYAMEVGKMPWEKVLQIIGEEKLKNEDKSFTIKLLATVQENISDLDKRISSSLSRWRLERLAKVDKNILRLALAEIFYFADIPIATSINEAVELAKKYSTEKSSKFINGILGNIVRKSSLCE